MVLSSSPIANNFFCDFADHWKKIRPILANDYSFLLILGVLMALISFGLDYVIEKFQMGMFSFKMFMKINE